MTGSISGCGIFFSIICAEVGKIVLFAIAFFKLLFSNWVGEEAFGAFFVNNGIA